MAFTDEDGQPSGYSVELCRRIADAVKFAEESPLPDLSELEKDVYTPRQGV